MKLLRIREVETLDGFRVRLTLTDGTLIERDLGSVLYGPVFEPVRNDRAFFEQVHVIEGGTIGWPNDADLDPDVLIWGGPPARDPAEQPLAFLQVQPQARTKAAG